MSPRASRDGKEGRRSWRYAKSSSKAAGSKKPYIIFLTLLLLGLVGLYWWAMRGTGYRNAHLAVIEVPANRRVSTTPFARNDVQRLLEVEILRTRDVWTDIRDNSDFADQVGPKVRTLLAKPRDNLILYINSPGISHDGKAYLTHSDFLTPGAISEGRHAVSDLLENVASAGEGVKLIVLDSTSVDVDPRLGLVVNEFVRLLEADVKKLNKDSNLFVLLPSGPFQVSTTSYGDRQSLFGKCLVDGLAGAADSSGVGDGNLFVTLYELYEYVRIGCATLIDSKLDVQQTPVLLQAGVGYIPPSIDLNTNRLRLTDVTGIEKAPAPEPTEAIEEKGEPSEKKQSDKTAVRLWPLGRVPTLALMQATAGNKQGPTEAAAEPIDKPATTKQPAVPEASVAKTPPENAGVGVSPESQPAENEKAAPAKLTPQELLLSQLEQAWRLRDAIQDPETRDVTPITFAPHLWRALEAELLFWEREVLADPVFDQSKTEATEGKAEPVLPLPKNVTAVEDLINTLTSLNAAISANRPQRSAANDRSIRTRLLKAWDRYVDFQLADEEKFTLREAPEVVQLRDQAREFDLLVYSLPYYVRWHARAHQSLSSDSSQHKELRDYLDAVVRLATTLSSLRAMPQLSYSDEYRLEQVGAQLAQASLLRSRLDSVLWEDRDRGSPIIGERLLATPLLDAQRRMQLLRALLQIAPGEPDVRAIPDARQDLSVSLKQWQRLHAHCELELRLVELAFGTDHHLVKSLSAELAEADKLAVAERAEADLWATYRRVGAQFGQCFESLPKSVLANDARDYAIHMMDYRDVDDPRNSDLDARPPLQLHLKYEPELKVEIVEEQNRQEFDLKLKEPRKIVLKIRATREKDASEQLKTMFESNLIDVTPEPQGPAEKKSGWYEQTAVYLVQAKPGIIQLPGRHTTNVTIRSNASEQIDQSLILKFTLPRPDQISLEVFRLSTRSQAVQQEHDSSLTLGVFPANLAEPAVTEFQFRARNESGEPRKIHANLYVVKPGRRVPQKHGTISQDRRKELFREQASSLDLTQLELVAEVGDMEVAPDQSAVLAFKAPGTAPPAAPPPATAPEQPATPPMLKDAGHGMVCVIRDETGKPWVKWIEIEPTPLHRYVTANCWYESGRVVVEVTGKPDLDDNFPANGLKLSWDTKPDFPDGTKRRIDATIMEPGDQHRASLYIEVEPDGLTRDVYIAVNGCPRVLSFRVACRRQAERIDSEETWIERRSIAITKLSIPETPKVFHIPTRSIAGSQDIYLDGPPPGVKPVEGEVFMERKQPVIIAMPIDALRVHFHLDAPVEGLRPERGDAVELLIDGERQGVAYGDRYLRSQLLGIGDNGVIRLGMQMQEQYIDIRPRDRDEELTLIGELTVDRRRTESTLPIPVIFDGTPPSIKRVIVPRQFDLESKHMVEVDVEELSGISTVRYWFSVSRERSVEKPLTAALLGPPIKDGGMFRLRFNVDTTGMDEGDYFLAVQVDDLVNLTSGVAHTRVPIKKKKEAAPVFATIGGTVQFSSAGDRLFTTVQLLTKTEEEVPGFAAQEVGDGNRYEFKQVPAGEYIIRAERKKSGTTTKVGEPVQVNKPGRLQVNLRLK